MAEINSYQITLTDDGNGDVDVSLNVLNGKNFNEILDIAEKDVKQLSASQNALLLAWNGINTCLEIKANDDT